MKTRLQQLLLLLGVLTTSAAVAQLNRLALMDTNGDGKVQRKELDSVPNTDYLIIQFNRYDANQDGGLDAAELEAAISAHINQQKHQNKTLYQQRKTTIKTLWLKLDRDENGVVSRKEAPRYMRLSNNFQIIDADGSGDVSSDELFEWVKGSDDLQRVINNLQTLVARYQREAKQAENLPEINLDIAVTSADQINTFVQRIVDALALDGAVVAAYQNNQLLYQQSFGDYGLATQLPVTSSSKWMTAAILMGLVQDRTLALDAPLSTYMARLQGDYRDMTLRQLISHTSGTQKGTGYLLSQPDDISFKDAAMNAFSHELIARPGKEFHYGVLSLQLAGYLAVKVTNKTWQQLFQEKLITPLGLKHSFYATVGRDKTQAAGPTANPMIGGGLYTTAADYLSFLNMIYNYGKYNNTQVLRPETVHMMEKDQLKHLNVKKNKILQGYGLGVFCKTVNDKGQCTKMHAGGYFGSLPWLDRDNNIYGLILVKDKLDRIYHHSHALIKMLTQYGQYQARLTQD